MTFAASPEVDGILVDLAADPRSTRCELRPMRANRGCPFAQNLVAEEIKSIVDSYRATANPDATETLRYVTILGGDDVSRSSATQTRACSARSPATSRQRERLDLRGEPAP